MYYRDFFAKATFELRLLGSEAPRPVRCLDSMHLECIAQLQTRPLLPSAECKIVLNCLDH